MYNKEKKMKLYYRQILALLKTYEGKNFLGKLVKNRQDIKSAYIRKAEDILLKMVEIDENSVYVNDIRKKLAGITK